MPTETSQHIQASQLMLDSIKNLLIYSSVTRVVKETPTSPLNDTMCLLHIDKFSKLSKNVHLEQSQSLGDQQIVVIMISQFISVILKWVQTDLNWKHSAKKVFFF